jgi:dipeptidyl-peptidase-4
MGLRGRIAVLSEGYSNADFATRIGATYNFVREVLSLAAEQGAMVKSLVKASARWKPESVAVRSTLAPGTAQDVVAEITEAAGEGSGGFARRHRTGVYRAIRMPVFDRFAAARKEALPAAYVIPPRLTAVVDLLRRQGVMVDRLTAQWRGRAQTFAIDTVVVDPLFEGHSPALAEGRWGSEPRDTVAGAGWYLVRTDQPLGVLAAYLLEPASEDGVVTWNLLDPELRPRTPYPILRVHQSPKVALTAVE